MTKKVERRTIIHGYESDGYIAVTTDDSRLHECWTEMGGNIAYRDMLKFHRFYYVRSGKQHTLFMKALKKSRCVIHLKTRDGVKIIGDK